MDFSGHEIEKYRKCLAFSILQKSWIFGGFVQPQTHGVWGPLKFVEFQGHVEILQILMIFEGL
jgi:hypothetical protein